MINIKNLSISYGGERVLENVTLSVAPGEHIAIMGPSGCGKTSLLRCIAGLLQPEKGKADINGSVSCVFQEPRLLPWFTAAENVNLVLGDNRQSMSAALDWLDRLGLSDSADKYPSELSGGMQQRLNIARALAYGGDILLLDEPLKGMDSALKESVSQLILSHSRSKTRVLVTHDEAEAQAFADRVYVYRDRNFYMN